MVHPLINNQVEINIKVDEDYWRVFNRLADDKEWDSHERSKMLSLALYEFVDGIYGLEKKLEIHDQILCEMEEEEKNKSQNHEIPDL